MISWKLVAFGVAVMVMVCAGANDLTVKRLLIVDDTNVKICFDTITLAEYDYFHLNIVQLASGDTDTAVDISATLTDSPETTKDGLMCLQCTKADCLSKEDQVKLGSQESDWELHIEDKEADRDLKPVLSAKIHMKMPSTLPVTSLSEPISVIGTDTQKILKFNEKFDNIYLDGEDQKIAYCNPGPACYYKKAITIDSDSSFMNCIQDALSEVPVCGDGVIEDPNIKEINIEDTTTETIITVDYDTTFTTFSSIDDLTFVDAIKTQMTSTDTCLPNCPIGTYEIYLVNYEDLKFQKKKRKDRDLDAYLLGSDTVEVEWKKLTNDYFQMQRVSTPTDNNIYHTASVNCKSVDGKICNAYFVGLTTGGTHAITIKEIGNWAMPETTGLDIWKKTTTKDLQSSDNMNDIEVENIQVRQDITEKEAKFDFKYNHEITNNSTHYEIILINNKGFWKKSEMKKEFNKNQECSTTINFPLDQFDEGFNLKMLVVARNKRTGKVIASDERTLQISEMKAIKPEIEDSSKGYTGTLAIVGAAIGGVACLMALVAAAVLFVMKRKRNNDGLQYPLHRSNIQDSNIVHGLDNLN
ncbi:unnamed protein product [Meganyctiphanes norvegica]|uniref:Uncharacterized protein n=1 Tax=Meganyctiphanes norvegica TaxID=48144 RepID=A0AAV2RA33_MEGNR